MYAQTYSFSNPTLISQLVVIALSSFVEGMPGRSFGGFLWKIDTNPPSYLFGTIHVDHWLVLNSLLPEFDEAFNQIDSLYVEINLFKPAILNPLTECMNKQGYSYVKGSAYIYKFS